MSNKYVRGLVIAAGSTIALIILFFIGALISKLRDSGAWTVLAGEQTAAGVGGWITWTILGGVLIFILYVFFAESPIWGVGTREVVMMGLGAALYGILAWVFNAIPVPSVSLVSLRPVIAIPVFFGIAFGPIVGFFSGSVGNILGDALTGWGVFPAWDMGNGLVGFIPGLAMMLLREKGPSFNWRNMLVVVAIVMLLAAILPLIFPSVVDPFSGEETTGFQQWWIISLVILSVVLLISLAPKSWPYILALLVVAMVVVGITTSITEGFSGGKLVLLLTALVLAIIGYFAYQREGSITAWLGDADTRAVVVWGTLGIIIGMGFASIADIWINGYSFATAIVGEFIPSAIPNILFSSILAPLLFAAWKQARSQVGR